MLKDVATSHPSNKIAQWTLAAYNGNASKLDVESNENYEILLQLMD